MRVGLIGLLALAGSIACSREVHSKAAVREAIEEHLQQQRSVAFENMTLTVGEVKFEGDTAVAQVKLTSKQALGVAAGVQYRLRRAGKGWQVESSSATSIPGATPASMPPAAGNPEDIGPQPSR